MFNRSFNLMIIAILAITVLCSGCEPLRKKFTRKKKAQVEDKGMAPVLEPQEYPTPEENPEANYQLHYTMVQVFYKELWNGIGEDLTEKNIRFNLDQVTKHLTEMKNMLVAEKQVEVTKLEQLLSYYQETLSQNRVFRNKARIESDLRAFHRQLIGACKPAKMQGYFIDAPKHASAN